MSAHPITASVDVDVSKEAVARRLRQRRFLQQDRALALRSQGMKPTPIAQEIGAHDARHVDMLVSAAGGRRATISKLVPHPDPDSFALTAPEQLLLRSVLEVRIENWLEGNASDPDTGWVGRRVRKSRGWAVSCANRRLGSRNYVPNPVAVFRLTGNGYIGLTDLGWRLATALHPDLVAELEVAQ